MDDAAILHELEATVEQLFARHLDSTKEWFPHEHIPYGRGRDATPDEQWSELEADLGGVQIDDAVRSSLIVNLLTEDNLPYYFRTIERVFGPDGAWGAWARRWTAEEGRHSMAIYGYLMVTRAVDPRALERARMAQVSGGLIPEPASAADGFVYVALQELATRIAHRNTGRLVGDPAGYDVMMRVAADENLHYLFYRDLPQAAIELDPSTMVPAIERQVVGFEMPGGGIPGFASHAAAIAKAGVYDLVIHHEQILVPVHPAPLEDRPARRPRRRGRAVTRPPDGAPREERPRRPPHRRAPRRARHDLAAARAATSPSRWCPGRARCRCWIVPPWAATAASAIAIPSPLPPRSRAAGRVGAVEALRHAGGDVRRHAGAVIGHRDPGRRRRRRRLRARPATSRRGVDEGVADDVGDHLAQAVLVAGHDERAVDVGRDRASRVDGAGVAGGVGDEP